jgi:hypothetical protein
MKCYAIAGLLTVGALACLAGPAEDRLFAVRIACDVQSASPQSLEPIAMLQGATPLLSIDTYANSRPVAADTNGAVVARFVMAPTATSETFIMATNLPTAVTGNGYLIQLPTVGTNTAGVAAGWWYSVRLERNDYVYWTGSGRVDIEATTSTADGLVWQTVASGVTAATLAATSNALAAAAAALDQADRTAASNLFLRVYDSGGGRFKFLLPGEVQP